MSVFFQCPQCECGWAQFLHRYSNPVGQIQPIVCFTQRPRAGRLNKLSVRVNETFVRMESRVAFK